jgi:inosine-uridine nucleoside N-ribohydrolase
MLLAIGPLTNVASLVEDGAAPDRIVAMAGVREPVWHRGRLHTTDHNTASDPAAARAVHDRARYVTTVPLDVTVHLRADDRQAAVLAGSHPRLGHEIAAWLRIADAVVLHDPLALLVAVGPVDLGDVGPDTAPALTQRIVELTLHATKPR